MVKEILVELASYHIWANDRIIELLSTLSPDYTNRPVTSSFGTLRLTLLHMWNAESVWLQRLNMSDNIVAPDSIPNLSLDQISSGIRNQSLQLKEWILNRGELDFDYTLMYQNSKMEQFIQPVYQVLLHVFNHATYHRGQLVNMLRQLGIEAIAPTDFIVWSRSTL